MLHHLIIQSRAETERPIADAELKQG